MGNHSLDKFFGDAVLQSLPMSVIILDNDATIRYINRASKGYFGYQAHELVGQPVSELILGYSNLVSIHQQHVVAKHKDGTRFELYISVSPFILGENRLFICTFQDSLDSRLDNTLLNSRDRMLAIFKEAPVGMMLVDMNGRPVETNQALQSMLMYSAAELKQMTFSSFTYSADTRAGLGLYTELVAGKRDHYQFEKRYLRKDGQSVHGKVTVSILRDEYGYPKYALSIIEEITVQKENNDTLSASAAASTSASEEKYRTLLNDVGDVILVVDQDGTIVDANKRVEDFLGYNKDEIQNVNFFSLLIGNKVKDYFAQSVTHDGLEPERLRDKVILCKDGSKMPVGVTLSVMEYAGKRYILSIIRDITERKKIEKQLGKAQEELELRVLDRTSALERANRQLLEQAVERKKTEQALRASEQRFRAVINNTPIILFALDQNGVFTMSEGKGLESIGLKFGEVVGQSIYSLYEDVEQVQEDFKRAMLGETFTSVLSLDHAVFELWWSPIIDQNNQVNGVIGVMTDITERTRAEEKIRASEKKLSTILSNMQDTFYRTNNDGELVLVSPSVKKLLGYSLDELIGENLKNLYVDPEGHSKFLAALKENDGELNSYEMAMNRKDGSIMHVSSNAQYCFDEGGEIIGIEGTTRDITERKQAEQHLRYVVNYDSLTKLPNRTLFRDRLDHAMAYARRYNHLVVLMFLDVDRFKTINDSLGHLVGDQLLQAVSERLRSCAREGDTVARLGGDEFAIVMEGIVDVSDADIAAKKVLGAMSKSFILEGHDMFVTASIGVTIYPSDSDDIESLIRNADTAMYRAKQAGRNNYQFYTEDMNTRAIESLLLQNNLRKALDNHEFLLYYQPQINLSSGEMIGMEALIRWQHPELGLLSPKQFISIAEETGLIIPIGEWVLRKVCLQLKEWQNRDLPLFRVSVNLSACQFKQRNLVGIISAIIEETGVDPSYIELEITEGVLVDDEEKAIEILHELKKLGMHISIDDFGTGYSSLSYLKRFPLNTLKIDKSFIRDISTDADDAAIAEAIIALGHSLRLKVIAEGVETLEQLEFLSPRGCDEVQGFYFSEPLPEHTIVDWMKNNQTGNNHLVH